MSSVIKLKEGGYVPNLEVAQQPICLLCEDGKEVEGEGSFACEYCTENGFTCVVCEETYGTDASFLDDDGALYCEHCYHERYCQCENCGCEILWEDALETPAGLFYCSSCFFEYYVHCDCCGEPEHIDSCYAVKNEHYCEACGDNNLAVCDSCEKYFLREDIIEQGAGSYCEDCHDDLFFTCVYCQEFIEIAVDEGIFKDGKYYCEDCFNEVTEKEDKENASRTTIPS